MNASVVGRPLRLLLSCLLAVALALLVVGVTQGRSLAEAADEVVGPGESIQKAIYAAHPGETIVVKGVHREDVVIRKDGIKLRGIDDAAIEAPSKAKADSPCSKEFGPEGICVLGDVDLQTGKVSRYVKNVSLSGFKISGFKSTGIDVGGARDATVTKIRAIGNENGIGTGLSVGTRILSNVVRGSGVDGDGIGLEDSRDVTIAKNDVEGTSDGAAIVLHSGTNATVVNNDLTGNLYGTSVFDSTGTTILSNDVSRSEFAGMVDINSPRTRILSNEFSRSGFTGVLVLGQDSANAKLVGNHISRGPFGIYVEDVHGGSVSGNQVHDNCAGMFFEAFEGEPVGGFEVTGNTVADNTRSCRSQDFDRNFSGIGIALLGASGMKVAANHLWGNVPTGPTPISGGVVVSKDPYFQDTDFGGKQKPTNNSVVANHFGRNKPDIYWDKTGTGNSFTANACDTGVPSSLCN